MLAVDDDGQGIPAAERDRVFERAYSGARPAARVGGGTGLGLAIVQGLAHAMHGEAAVGESPTGGARFELRLPLAPAPMPAPPAAPALSATFPPHHPA